MNKIHKQIVFVLNMDGIISCIVLELASPARPPWQILESFPQYYIYMATSIFLIVTVFCSTDISWLFFTSLPPRDTFIISNFSIFPTVTTYSLSALSFLPLLLMSLFIHVNKLSCWELLAPREQRFCLFSSLPCPHCPDNACSAKCMINMCWMKNWPVRGRHSWKPF